MGGTLLGWKHGLHSSFMTPFYLQSCPSFNKVLYLFVNIFFITVKTFFVFPYEDSPLNFFVHSFLSNRTFIFQSLYPFIHSFAPLFIHLIILLFIFLLIFSFIYTSIHTFSPSFLHSFNHSFTYLSYQASDSLLIYPQT